MVHSSGSFKLAFLKLASEIISTSIKLYLFCLNAYLGAKGRTSHLICLVFFFFLLFKLIFLTLMILKFLFCHWHFKGPSEFHVFCQSERLMWETNSLEHRISRDIETIRNTWAFILSFSPGWRCTFSNAQFGSTIKRISILVNNPLKEDIIDINNYVSSSEILTQAWGLKELWCSTQLNFLVPAGPHPLRTETLDPLWLPLIGFLWGV